MKKISSAVLATMMLASFVSAQTAEVRVSLNDQFFDALLDAIFKNFNAPEFPIAAAADSNYKIENPKSVANALGFSERAAQMPVCSESIRLLRETNGVRTAVRFRDGKIYAPIAFSGSYNPPLIGCIDFQGWAETNIDLEFDARSRKLFGKVRVLNVQLNGTGGIGSSVLTKLVQSSIDKKINPIEIMQIDKLSFLVPIQNADGSLRMKAVGVRHEVINGVLNIFVAYQFLKS